MPFLDHLAELRTRIANSVLATFIALLATYAFRQHLFAIMVRPLGEAWSTQAKSAGLGTAELVFTSPTEAFMVLLKLSLLCAVFLASPVIFYQGWKFIAPGLYPRERRFGLLFVVFSVLLFVGGAAFAYVFVLPKGYEYFLGYSSESMGIIREVFGKQINVQLSTPFAIRPMITMSEYFDLTAMLLLVFGLVFELPLILSMLAMLGIVSAGQLWRWNRYAILAFSVAGAVLTPGDLVIGQLAMCGALTILYNLSIVIALVVQRKRQPEDDAEAAGSDGDGGSAAAT